MKMADDDLQRALRNWALWRIDPDSRIATSCNPLYLQGPRGPRGGVVMPVLNGEALDMDAIITALPGRYYEVIRVHYLWNMTPHVAARRCRCCVQTYYNRLERAWDLIAQARRDKHQAALRIAEAHRVAHAARMTC